VPALAVRGGLVLVGDNFVVLSYNLHRKHFVMAGLVPAIQSFSKLALRKFVDARHN
jgi:hypothetical protein